MRKLQFFWAILHDAGYKVDESRLKSLAPTSKTVTQFNPCFTENIRSQAYSDSKKASVPPPPESLDALVAELKVINGYRRASEGGNELKSTSGKPLFDSDDKALLEFLDPPNGRSGTSLLKKYRKYHHPDAGDFVKEILHLLDEGETVILDLGNANPEVLTYFSDELSKAVFNHQVDKFSNNALGDHYVQLYFEEAHNLFPRNDEDNTIYTRFAKEGAKYHIGMVYSTQSPTTISRDLLAQTENFFIAHLSSQDDVQALARVNIAYESLANDILLAKTPGYMRMLTSSHRFVVSVQARKFVAPDGTSDGISKGV